MARELEPVFVRLRKILEKRQGNFAVSEDTPTRYCLTGGCHPTHKGSFPIAWVQISKNYVGFHHMGVYGAPEVLAGASKKLKARMQGKSCFNFKTVDEPLFQELEELSSRAFETFKQRLAALNARTTSSR